MKNFECNVTVYFVILFYMNYSVLHPLVKNNKKHNWCLNNLSWQDYKITDSQSESAWL